MSSEALHHGSQVSSPTLERLRYFDSSFLTVLKEPKTGNVELNIPVDAIDYRYTLKVRYPDPVYGSPHRGINLSFHLPGKPIETNSLSLGLGSIIYAENGQLIEAVTGTDFDSELRGVANIVHISMCSPDENASGLRSNAAGNISKVEHAMSLNTPDFIEIRVERDDSKKRKTIWVPKKLSTDFRNALTDAASENVAESTKSFFQKPLEMNISYALKAYVLPFKSKIMPEVESPYLTFFRDEQGNLVAIEHRAQINKKASQEEIDKQVTFKRISPLY